MPTSVVFLFHFDDGRCTPIRPNIYIATMCSPCLLNSRAPEVDGCRTTLADPLVRTYRVTEAQGRERSEIQLQLQDGSLTGGSVDVLKNAHLLMVRTFQKLT
jgi:hypothetical protein